MTPLGAAKRGKKAVEVREEKVQARDLVASVTASGQVQPRLKVDIASDVAGRIVLPAGEVPAAIMLALVGGPIFVAIARRRRRLGL